MMALVLTAASSLTFGPPTASFCSMLSLYAGRGATMPNGRESLVSRRAWVCKAPANTSGHRDAKLIEDLCT
jgi:hypothetical protein